MAFKTNLVPAVEERTVSGSSVSFNSAFALPLKACKVSFSATQAGSGEPSPSNPRAISGVSAIGLTANSTPVSVSLGEERFGGELDVLTGELTINYAEIVFNGTETWNIYGSTTGYYCYLQAMKQGRYNDGLSNRFKIISSNSQLGIMLGYDNKVAYFCQINQNISEVTDLATWKTWLSNNNVELVYPLAEPITIQLSANELSSIIGNNTFSTDTGTLEITFADLQEKSASGSVASFNTALAMPLSSCNIAVNAWQEGSDDPYPAGGSAQIWDEEWELGILDVQTGNKVSSSTRIRTKNYIPILPNSTYYKVSPATGFRFVLFYNTNKEYLGYLLTSGTGSFTSPNDAYYMRSYTESDSYGTTYKNDISINYPATDTSYHPYSNVRPIHGWTESNLANMSDSTKVQFFKGLLNGTYGFVDLGTLDWKYEPNLTYPRFVTLNVIADAKTSGQNYMAMGYEVDNAAITSTDKDNTIWLYITQKLFIHNFTYTSVDSFKSAMSGVYLIYELATPTTPTITKAQFEMLLNAFGISGELYTIQLGQEVYGAEVDAVNGVAHCTHQIVDLGSLSWFYFSNTNPPHFGSSIRDIKRNTNALKLCSIFKIVYNSPYGYANLTIRFSQLHNLDGINASWTDYTTSADFKNAVRGQYLVYELATPFDIQLTPTQIETIIGNNTIFADTGDIDLTYKDLDIAKRGNFREVFKLPS